MLSCRLYTIILIKNYFHDKNSTEINFLPCLNQAMHECYFLRNSNWKEDPVYFFAKATCTKSLLITVLPCLQQESYFLFRSVPFRASELALPRNSECLGMSTLFRGITESVPSLYRGIFLERNSFPNPMYSTNPELCSVP